MATKYPLRQTYITPSTPSVEEEMTGLGDGLAIVVREYDAETDRMEAEAVHRLSDDGGAQKMSLHTELVSGPTSRIGNFPVHLLLVAKTIGPVKRIVALVGGCVKVVTCGKKTPKRSGNDGVDKQSPQITAVPIYVKVGYMLGLRVLPSYRRMGIGLNLVRKMEEWFKEKGAEYAYMATEKTNEASLNLFTGRCGYSKFRTASILVHPVFEHRLTSPGGTALLRLSPSDAELIYRRRFAAKVEFFPRDINVIIAHPLSLGTLLSVPTDWLRERSQWPGAEAFLASPPASWAVASVWDCSSVLRMEVRGASLLLRAAASATRMLDRALPWLRVPSVPDIFRPFGAWFLYGVFGEGTEAEVMVSAAWREAHNMARGRAAVLAAEVAEGEPIRRGIPRWRKLSYDEDVWCAKRLDGGDYSDGEIGDWTKSRTGPSIFVDPREL